MNPKVDLTATNWANVKTGYIPSPKKKATCWSLYSRFGDCLVYRQKYSAIAAKLKAIPKANAIGLKKIKHYD